MGNIVEKLNILNRVKNILSVSKEVRSEVLFLVRLVVALRCVAAMVIGDLKLLVGSDFV